MKRGTSSIIELYCSTELLDKKCLNPRPVIDLLSAIAGHCGIGWFLPINAVPYVLFWGPVFTGSALLTAAVGSLPVRYRYPALKYNVIYIYIYIHNILIYIYIELYIAACTVQI